jgi:hypothetical protein
MKKVTSSMWEYRGWQIWVNYHPWKYYELYPPDDVSDRFYKWWDSPAPLHFFTQGEAKQIIRKFMEEGDGGHRPKRKTTVQPQVSVHRPWPCSASVSGLIGAWGSTRPRHPARSQNSCDQVSRKQGEHNEHALVR